MYIWGPVTMEYHLNHPKITQTPLKPPGLESYISAVLKLLNTHFDFLNIFFLPFQSIDFFFIFRKKSFFILAFLEITIFQILSAPKAKLEINLDNDFVSRTF